MKNIYIILIFIFSFTIFSCAKKSDTSSTSTTSIPSYVAVGCGGTILTSSDNGTTWTTRTSGIEGDYTEYLNDVTYGNTTFVAVSSLGTILTSGDGTSWTQRTWGDHSGEREYLSGVTYSQ